MPPKRVDWSPSERNKAVILCKEGCTYEQIAKRLGDGATKLGVKKICNPLVLSQRPVKKSKVIPQIVTRINNILKTAGVQLADQTVSCVTMDCEQVYAEES
ncbi:hypothetical protein ILUMI_15137 [Ignelater luminosus]|uniref:Uncharacterized protein n=1 Tax=Ignelater luminosus TaxID=2038154 RepID=A0A8K0CSW0_IGNLU|nr:hypothetical protein ILUMI_15137 [Ignelater luminosus]